MSATPSVAPDGPEYRDFSMEESRGGGVNRTMDCFTVRDGNFPTKLHPMLSAAEANGMSDIVGFRPQGRCFMVYKPKEFVDKVLSRFYRQKKYASFVRQLNMYGFTRLKLPSRRCGRQCLLLDRRNLIPCFWIYCRHEAGPDKSAYYHEKFLRGKPLLAAQIYPIKDKEAPNRGTLQVEPNFYEMPALPVVAKEPKLKRGGVAHAEQSRQEEQGEVPALLMSSRPDVPRIPNAQELQLATLVQHARGAAPFAHADTQLPTTNAFMPPAPLRDGLYMSLLPFPARHSDPGLPGHLLHTSQPSFAPISSTFSPLPNTAVQTIFGNLSRRNEPQAWNSQFMTPRVPTRYSAHIASQSNPSQLLALL